MQLVHATDFKRSVRLYNSHEAAFVKADRFPPEMGLSDRPKWRITRIRQAIVGCKFEPLLRHPPASELISLIKLDRRGGWIVVMKEIRQKAEMVWSYFGVQKFPL